MIHIELISAADTLALLSEERDIVIQHIGHNRLYLSYPPLDVCPSVIHLDDDCASLTITDALVILSREILNITCTPVYDSKGQWSHTRLGQQAEVRLQWLKLPTCPFIKNAISS